MKILVLGHGQHGKDTVAALLSLILGLTYISSSMFALKLFLFDILNNHYHLNYQSLEDAFLDRHAHRDIWRDEITKFNTPVKNKLAKELLLDYDMYIGMRDPDEHFKSVQDDLFDVTFWVDASERKPLEPTMGILQSSDMIEINNNGTMLDLAQNTIDAIKKANRRLSSSNRKLG